LLFGLKHLGLEEFPLDSTSITIPEDFFSSGVDWMEMSEEENDNTRHVNILQLQINSQLGFLKIEQPQLQQQQHFQLFQLQQ
jgi:hypothetical protein